MRVKHAVFLGRGRQPAITVDRPDADGDVYLKIATCYLDVPTVRRLIRALQWAIAPRGRKGA
jgi:hypothetical protein